MAEIASLESMVPYLQLELPGAEKGLVYNALMRAATQFCEDSEVWKNDRVTPVVPGQTSYDISEDFKRVQRIDRVRVVDPSVEDDMSDVYSGRSIDLGYCRLDSNPDTIVFLSGREPNDSEEGFNLVVTVVDVPDADTDELPSYFLTRWSRAIRSLVLYSLRLHARMPWYDPNRAAVDLGDYEQELNKARFETFHEYLSVDARMTAPSFL